MNRLLTALAGILVAVAVALPARAATVVAVDPGFAPVASILLRLFSERTGHDLVLSVAAAPVLAEIPADVLLAPDAAMAAELAQTGQADPDSLITYATDPEAATPRDAVLLRPAARNAVAQEFLAFLLTPEAWDVIVAHGFGAH